MTLEEVKVKLKQYNQQHLLRFYDELNNEEKKHLLDQINIINFDLMGTLFKTIGYKKTLSDISAIPNYDFKPEYSNIGFESMKKGEYAAVTMAGGQGTRLGFEGPKGTYVLGYGINKSIFEIHCDKLKHINEKTGLYIPWYIMTSGTNNDDTITFFKNNNYFNYPKEMVHFFIQDELPMIDTEGKILMDSKSNIKMGANGSGGVYSSLIRSGIIEQMKNSNIKWVLIGGIDNILTPFDRPELIGFAISSNFSVASYITKKSYPEERVGVFGKINGKPNVIEYFDMTPEMNNARDENGNLLYSAAHLLINLFSIEALDIISRKELEYIPAFKKTSYIDENGNLINPEKENAYKFETFVFGVFPYFDEIGLLNGKREEIFAPIKNAEGLDSPESAGKLYLDYYINVH